MKRYKFYEKNGDFPKLVPVGHLGEIEGEFDSVGLEDVEQELNIKLSEEQQTVKEVLKEMLDVTKDTWGMLLLGGVGNGKTMLGCSAVNSWNARAIDCHLYSHALYIKQSDIVLKSRGFKEQEVVNKLCDNEVGLLFIDELDKDGWNDNLKQIISEIVLHYYEKRDTKRLIMAGNVLPKDLGFGIEEGQTKMFTDRMIDRLRSENVKRFVLSSKSYRGRNNVGSNEQ